MGALAYFRDRLTNVMSGMGTTVDRNIGRYYSFSAMDAGQAESAYRSSWLVRKIIDIPPFDMTREWRGWQAADSDIEALEAEEARLQLAAKCQRALILARLYGGGALILGTGDADPMQPLNPAIGKDGLKYIHVMSRHQLTTGKAILDLESPWFGEPEYFEINASGQQRQGARLHPSRVVAFIGQRAPEGSVLQVSDWYWGDPIMQSIGEAVKNADTAQAGFAALIDEAKIDIIKIPRLMEQVGTTEYETRLMNRLAAAQAGKSTWRALVIDGEEEWEQRQITWAGMRDMIDSFLEIVAGASDIPVTRMLGQSPKGLQSTGSGEKRDYNDMVRARQEEQLGPALDRIDALLIPSALGNMPSDIYYEFNPLDQPTEKEAAEIEKIFAEVARTYADTGLIQNEALSEMIKNGVVERGQWPGSEAAFEKHDGEELPVDEEPDVDPSALVATEPAKPNSTGQRAPRPA